MIVATPQVRIAEPVVRDVDPLRKLQGGRPRDIGVVLAQEAAPGQVDGLWARVAGDTESGVEVLGGKR